MLEMTTPPYSVRGSQALQRLIQCEDVHSVLDVGSGTGEHAEIMRSAGMVVTTISYEPPADIIGDFVSEPFLGQEFDAIWASHVLEHQPNVNLFLRHCHNLLRSDGVLAVTIPPHKHNVVGGHLATFNAGQLLYHLIIAGFDCSEARVSGNYSSGHDASGNKYPPYNISVLVRKRKVALPALRFDSGDVARLAHFFPAPVADGFDGRLPPIGW